MGIETTLETPLAEAVRRAGSQSAFARVLGTRQSTVFDWLRLEKHLPAEHVLTVERETGVSRHDLRPDIYPFDPPAAAEHVSVTGPPVRSNDAPAFDQERGA